MIEIENKKIGLKPSMGTEVKEKTTETFIKDFRDFIEGNITMDELFKKMENEE